MVKPIFYRKQVLEAVEAFLEETPSASAHAAYLIQQCYDELSLEEKYMTLDDIVFGFFVRALTDSVFYENKTFLLEVREILRGHSSHSIERSVFCLDCRPYFTVNEGEWYMQLVSLVHMLTTFPFGKIYEASHQARQQKESWDAMCTHIPEIIRAAQTNEEYVQKTRLIEAIVAKSPSPGDFGDEKIYHLVLREVTTLLTGLDIGKAAAFFGYPILKIPHSRFGSRTEPVDMTASIRWTEKVLKALAGEGELFLCWYLSNASSFGADVIVAFVR